MHHGGFAAAGRTHQRDKLTCPHFNIYPSQSIHSTISNDKASSQILCADDVHLVTTCSPALRPETISTFESPRSPTVISRLSVEEPFHTCTMALSLPEAC